jgi:hypothetical protein
MKRPMISMKCMISIMGIMGIMMTMKFHPLLFLAPDTKFGQKGTGNSKTGGRLYDRKTVAP